MWLSSWHCWHWGWLALCSEDCSMQSWLFSNIPGSHLNASSTCFQTLPSIPRRRETCLVRTTAPRRVAGRRLSYRRRTTLGLNASCPSHWHRPEEACFCHPAAPKPGTHCAQCCPTFLLRPTLPGVLLAGPWVAPSLLGCPSLRTSDWRGPPSPFTKGDAGGPGRGDLPSH